MVILCFPFLCGRHYSFPLIYSGTFPFAGVIATFPPNVRLQMVHGLFLQLRQPTYGAESATQTPSGVDRRTKGQRKVRVGTDRPAGQT